MKNITVQDIKKEILLERKFCECIKRIIYNEKNIDEKIRLIEYLSSYYVEHITGCYSDFFLERELAKIGNQIKFTSSKFNNGKCLHIMTKASSVGGHTAIVRNWIEFDDSRTYDVAFTDSDYAHVPQFLRETVKSNKGKILILKKKNPLSKAEELLELAKDYDKVILHIHMYDVVPILAFSNRKWNRPIYFYNHGNFTFSLGMSIADSVLNLCEYDKKRAKCNRGAKRSYVLPNPQNVSENIREIETKKQVKSFLCKKYNLSIDSKIILSAGGNFKFSKIVGYDFQKFAIDVLKESPYNTFFFIVGADYNEERWKIMEKETNGRGRALGVLERDELSQWLKIADIYVTSFPMMAYGNSEAFRNGIPCFTLNIIDRASEYMDGMICLDINTMKKAVIEEVTNPDTNLQAKKRSIKQLERLDKEKWCNILNDIFSIKIKHKLHKFASVPIIDKEEVINYQLFNGNDNLYKQYNLNEFKLINRIQIFIISKVVKCRKKLVELI